MTSRSTDRLLAGPARTAARRTVIALIPIALLGGIAAGCAVAGPVIGLLAALPAVLVAGFLLAGPLGRRSFPISAVSVETGPLHCARCSYLIMPAHLARCPECGHDRVSDEVASSSARSVSSPGQAFADVARPGLDQPAGRGYRAIGQLGEAITILGILGPLLFLAHLSATGGDFPTVLTVGVFFGGLGVIGISVPGVIAQVATRGRIRRAWIPGALCLVAASVVFTGWPRLVAWPLHVGALERLHARVAAGEAIEVPRRVGLFQITRIEELEGGGVGYFRSGTNGLIRMPDATSRPSGLNTWSLLELSPRWWSHFAD